MLLFNNCPSMPNASVVSSKPLKPCSSTCSCAMRWLAHRSSDWTSRNLAPDMDAYIVAQRHEGFTRISGADLSQTAAKLPSIAPLDVFWLVNNVYNNTAISQEEGQTKKRDTATSSCVICVRWRFWYDVPYLFCNIEFQIHEKNSFVFHCATCDGKVCLMCNHTLHGKQPNHVLETFYLGRSGII